MCGSIDLCEESRPDWLDFGDARGFNDGGEFVGLWMCQLSLRSRIGREEIVYGDLDAIVSEDEGRVGVGELSGRHCEVFD